MAAKALAKQMEAQFSGKKLDEDPFAAAADEVVELAPQPRYSGTDDRADAKLFARRMGERFGRGR